MCARDNVDQKNMYAIKQMCSEYPDVVWLYITSLTKKTSYTKKAYAYYVCKFLDYICNRKKIKLNNNIKYNSIIPMDIDAYIESIKYNKNGKEKSATYLTAQFAAIHGFFKFLKRNGLIKSDPCEDTEVPRDNQIHTIITIDDNDMNKILQNIKYGVGSKKAVSTQAKWIWRDTAFITLGTTIGLRLSAIVGLNIDDISFNENSIVVTEKGNIQRKIYFGDNASQILRKWLVDRSKMNIVDQDAVFISQGGHRMATRTAQDLMKRITTGTEKHITPHKMRATCATRLYEATGDIYRVQTQLGHKNIENTKRYAKVSIEKQIESANILDSMF